MLRIGELGKESISRPSCGLVDKKGKKRVPCTESKP